jgi:hypothetical protein
VSFVVILAAVTSGLVVRGHAATYRFLRQNADGTPYRWDPCTPIHYLVNDAPPGSIPIVQEAVARVSEATGITFVYDGIAERSTDTYYRMQFQRPFTLGGSRSWEPVLIDWIETEHFQELAQTDEAAAFGTPYSPEGELPEGVLEGRYVSGLVAVDESLPIPLGFRTRYSLGVVLMHELAHVMGLGHVADGHELMWSPEVPGADAVPDVLQTVWGPGDLEGLHRLGRQEACPAA